jgi:hypothetical protein
LRKERGIHAASPHECRETFGELERCLNSDVEAA